MIKLFVLIAFTFTAVANDTLTVVAVGEAEAEKDEIFFSFQAADKEMKASQTKKVKTVFDVFKSDFDFYKHAYTQTEQKSEKSLFQVTVDVKLEEGAYVVGLKTENLKEKKSLLDEKFPMDFDNVRDFAHSLTDKVYQALTGEKSIFRTKIYFVSDRTSRGKKLSKELYVMDFDGANKKRITYLNSVIISPSLSHDNSKVVYTLVENKVKKSAKGDGSLNNIKNLNLHLMDLNTRKTKLVSSIDGINSGAIFNKAGDSLYLTLSYQRNADLFKLNLKNYRKTRITNHFSDDVDPFINADESLMTFLSGRAGKAMIYTLDPTGVERSVKRISFVGRFNAAPRFNPDGTEIVFSSWVDNRFDLFRIGSDGKNLVRLTKNFGSNEEPWYSPDGQFIVFTSQRVITRKKAVQDVYIMNRDGEVLRKITENYGKITTPRWSNY